MTGAGRPGRQQALRVRAAAGEDQGVLIGKVFFLDVDRLITVPLPCILADAVWPRLLHLAGDPLLCGAERRQVQLIGHPHQDLTGIEQAGLGAQDLGADVEQALPGQAGQLRRGVKGQGGLHALHPARSFGLVEDGDFQQAIEGGLPLPHLLALEQQAGGGIPHLPDVRLGVRDDDLGGLLLLDAGPAHHRPALGVCPAQFQFFHGNPSFPVFQFLGHSMSPGGGLDRVFSVGVLHVENLFQKARQGLRGRDDHHLHGSSLPPGCNKPVCPSVCRGQTGRVWAYFSQGLFSFASSYRRT